MKKIMNLFFVAAMVASQISPLNGAQVNEEKEAVELDQCRQLKVNALAHWFFYSNYCIFSKNEKG